MYSDSINDRKKSRETRQTPPLFAVLPIRGVLVEALTTVIPETIATSVPVLHGEHDIFISRPIEIGMLLQTRALPLGIRLKEAGTTIAVKVETSDEVGLVNEQYANSFLPGVTKGEDAGNESPSFRMNESVNQNPDASVSETTDADQSLRYAAASGDFSPMHVDEDAARSMGFDGVIMHGLCTMAFAARAVLKQFGNADPTRLRRIAGRFTAPAYPGEQIETRIWKLAPHSFAFQTISRNQPVIKFGAAELMTG